MFFERAFRECHLKGAYLWGLNTSANLMDMDIPGTSVKTSLGLVNGGVWSFIEVRAVVAINYFID